MSDYSQPPQFQQPVRPAKDVVIAYVLLVFLGIFGVHKFYLLHTGSGILYLILGLIGMATFGIVVGVIFLLPLALLLIIDLFTIPKRVREINAGRA